MARLNIVVVLLDDCPPNAFTATYMPWLTSRPDGSWIKFNRMFANFALCAPSRAATLSGRLNENNGVTTNSGVELDKTTLVGPALQRVGYMTGLFGKPANYSVGLTPWPGWSRWFAYSAHPVTYFNYAVSDNGVQVNFGSTDADYATDVFFAEAVEWVTSAREPFFAYVAPYGPHTDGGAAIPATRHANLYPGLVERPASWDTLGSNPPPWLVAKFPTPMSASRISGDDNKRRKAHQADRSVDEGMEDIRDALTARGVWDRTVFFVLTDNGDTWGEKRTFEKTTALDACINQQMWARYPGTPLTETDELAMNVDLAPTWCDIGRARMPVAPDGHSLLPVLRDGATGLREATYHYSGAPGGEYPNYRAVRTNRWKYVDWFGASPAGQTELYDLAADPDELVNLVDAPGYQEVRRQLSADLEVVRP